MDVLEWRVFYEKDIYCSCHDKIEDLPENGVQAVAWFIWKDGSVRCEIEGGLTTDPSIYYVEGRGLVGTMLPDAVYDELEQDIYRKCDARVRELRRIHG